MKRALTIISISVFSMLLSSCWPNGNDQVKSYFYKEVIYEFNNPYSSIDYYTADLLSCYGVKDLDNPSQGTIYASVKVTANTNSQLDFKYVEGGIEETYLTKHMEYPQVKYYATPFSQICNMATGETTTLNLVFPNVPSSILKVGSIHVHVTINDVKLTSFTIHQIPYRPESDILSWR